MSRWTHVATKFSSSAFWCISSIQLVLRNIVMQTAETQTDPNALIPEDTLKMAVIVIGTVPILIVYPFLQKHFAAGVMVGAVKG